MIQSNARHWMIIVRSVQDNLMEVIAIPGNVQPKFYLQAVLALPDNHTVRNIQFGDSGNSSLSPNLDIDAVTNEGRQSLGLIIERQEVLSDGSEELHEELWVFKYDEILFEKFYWGRILTKQSALLLLTSTEKIAYVYKPAERQEKTMIMCL